MMSSKLDEYRKEIDGIDNELVALFCRRMEISEKISLYKKENGLPTYAPGRERALLARVAELAGPDCGEYAEALYRTVLAASRSYQNTKAEKLSSLYESIQTAQENTRKLFPQRASIACFASEGSEEQLVCETLMRSPSPMFFDTAEHTMRAVERGMCSLGVIRAENSRTGMDGEIIRQLSEHGLYVVRSLSLEKRLNLAANYGTDRSQVRTLFADGEAAGLCSSLLSGMRGAALSVTRSGAEAARAAAETPDSAAIAARYTCEHYGLGTLAESVQDIGGYDRYFCFAKSFDIYPGADRILFSFTLQNTPGALYELLSRFGAADVNVRQLRSNPLPGREFELQVLLEADVSVYAPALGALLRDLGDECGELRCLGVYSEVK